MAAVGQDPYDHNEEWGNYNGSMNNSAAPNNYGGYASNGNNHYYNGGGYDYGQQMETPVGEVSQDFQQPLSEVQTIDLFRDAVNAARDDGRKRGLAGNINGAMQMSLTVDLKKKGIGALSDEVIQIMKVDVERIVLSHNFISILPDRFAECSNMQYLNLRGNRFTEFPKPLLKMSRLQILDMSRNSIESLPDEIRQMKSLRVLSVSNNQLSEVPFCMGTLDNLRILKLMNNPVNRGLKAIIDSRNSITSASGAQMTENERDTLLTIKIKQYLKNEGSSHEWGGDSSDGPLDTPRPLKRNPSLRFPVVPASGSESTSPNPAKPGMAGRSHYRMASGQNGTAQNSSVRRPQVTPINTNNERNRSQSESVLQAQQNSRNKRMGIVSRKTELTPLEESQGNRNSLHFRGSSHGSVLKDHKGRLIRNNPILNTVSPGGSRLEEGIFLRRLASLPEVRADNFPVDPVVEGAQNILFSFYSMQPHITSLVALTEDNSTKRSSLGRIFHTSSIQLESLDHELSIYRSAAGDENSQRRPLRNIRRACKTCIVAYLQVARLLMDNANELLSRGDPRYIRMLLVQLYGSTMEVTNAYGALKNIKPQPPDMQTLSVTQNQARQEEKPLAKTQTPINSRAQSTRRVWPDANRPGHQPRNRSGTLSQNAVPLYINGRSRSDSRNNMHHPSSGGSIGTTPRSGESFHIPATPNLPAFEANASSGQSHDPVFDKVFYSFRKFIDHGLIALPAVCAAFRRCLETAQARFESKKFIDALTSAVSVTKSASEMCQKLNISFNNFRINDPEARNSPEFWVPLIRFTNFFTALCQGLKRHVAEYREQLQPLQSSRTLSPMFLQAKEAFATIKESPWAYVLSPQYLNSHSPRPSTSQTQTQQHIRQQHSRQGSATGSPGQVVMQSSAYRASPRQSPRHSPQHSAFPSQSSIASRRVNGVNGSGGGSSGGPPLVGGGPGGPGGAGGGHHRTRGDSGSSSSPYMPATPLSAALGPAAQATMPSGMHPQQGQGSNSFDQSFRGDVFQRAEFALSNASVFQRR